MKSWDVPGHFASDAQGEITDGNRVDPYRPVRRWSQSPSFHEEILCLAVDGLIVHAIENHLARYVDRC